MNDEESKERRRKRRGLTDSTFRLILLCLVVLPWVLIWWVTLPSDVLRELRDFRLEVGEELREELRQGIKRETADRFKGQDFLDFTDANSELVVPQDLKEKLENGKGH